MPTQLYAMFQFGHIGVIFIDATFSTNNVKYHLFTLMNCDLHCTKVRFFFMCVFYMLLQDSVELKPCPNFLLHLAFVESLTHMVYEKNQTCGGEASNI
jgi:hypothetical protein